jgi:hypothetical protein
MPALKFANVIQYIALTPESSKWSKERGTDTQVSLILGEIGGTSSKLSSLNTSPSCGRIERPSLSICATSTTLGEHNTNRKAKIPPFFFSHLFVVFES